MLFRIREDTSSPLYQQIIDQVKTQVADGTLRKGDRLPSVRELAATLRVNVSTAYRAYKELEAQGVVRMRVGFGVTIIAERQHRINDEERGRLLLEMVDRLRVEAYHLGFGTDDLIRILKQSVEEGSNEGMD